MYVVRRWSVRRANFFEWLYEHFEWLLRGLHPIFSAFGYARLERPVAAVERVCKGILFDCQMCGKCALSATGMSCPMNCPKSLRNGPCGGVRPDGNCEVEPNMHCVWVDAWEGSRRMHGGDTIREVQEPVDYRLKGTSSWLRVVRQKADDASK